MNRLSAFAIVGMVGFIADAGAFALFYYVLDQPMWARVFAFWLAASVTWLGNRYFTFSECDKSHKLRQWARHMAVAHVAGILNLAVFYVTALLAHVAIAFVAGIGAGLCLNYMMSSRLVFKT